MAPTMMLVRTNHPCLRMGCHTSPGPELAESSDVPPLSPQSHGFGAPGRYHTCESSSVPRFESNAHEFKSLYLTTQNLFRAGSTSVDSSHQPLILKQIKWTSRCCILNWNLPHLRLMQVFWFFLIAPSRRGSDLSFSQALINHSKAKDQFLKVAVKRMT
jgi:hypothetical protein